jgi:lipopolysaccharide transport system ATP-binding protein
MTSIAIRTEMLGKRYRIGVLAERPRTLREAITLAMSAPVRNFRQLRGAASPSAGDGLDLIWALRDVSFEVQEGEVVGIIGRNGAGKTTLLKLLCRITEPTTGFADIYGRVGSLLEVGTGFHHELTGRDNIYLSGSILGMDRGYIDRRFDEIVQFAAIESFLDTPVKRYSSGMYLRLAFAVAAHLEPEVLIVDEVLAVGDAEFQKKCLGKMDTVAREGRTVLFVSHNLDAIQRLCSRSILLERGTLIADGPTSTVVTRYMSSTAVGLAPGTWIDLSGAARRGTGAVRVQAVTYSSGNAALGFHPYSNGPLEFLLAVDSNSSRYVGGIAVSISSLSGARLVNANSVLFGMGLALRKGRSFIRLRIKSLHLTPGTYRVSLWLADPISAKSSSRAAYDWVEDAIEIEVVSDKVVGFGLKAAAYVTCDIELEDLTQRYSAPSPDMLPRVATP